MQLSGTLFGHLPCLVMISTFPDFPADIRLLKVLLEYLRFSGAFR